MTAIALLESLESRGITLRLAGGEVHADFVPGTLTDADREWIKRFRHDLTAVLTVRALRPPRTPMPAPGICRPCVASWPETWRRQWAQLTLDHQLAGFDPEQAEWRAFLATVPESEPDLRFAYAIAAESARECLSHKA
jgi:hypothetical protein